MCSIESTIQQPLTEYANALFGPTLYSELSADLSNLNKRIATIASSVWNIVQEYAKAIDEATLYYRKTISWFITSTLSSLTARFVLYSLNELSGEEYQERANIQLATLNSEGSQTALQSFATTLNATLSTVTLVHPPQINPSKHTIVYFPTNFEIWQASIDYLISLHKEACADVYALNYRGTGGSNGFAETEDMLINDGLAYVQDLIAKGVPADKIALFGGDIGGAVAVAVAAKLAEQGIVVDIISIRSFKTLTAVIREALPVAPDLFANFAAKMHWKLNAEADLPKLKGNFICMSSDQDPILPVAIQIKAALEAAPTNTLQLQSTHYIKMDENAFVKDFPQLAEDPDCNPHIRPFAKSEQVELIAAIKSLWKNTI